MIACHLSVAPGIGFLSSPPRPARPPAGGRDRATLDPGHHRDLDALQLLIEAPASGRPHDREIVNHRRPRHRDLPIDPAPGLPLSSARVPGSQPTLGFDMCHLPIAASGRGTPGPHRDPVSDPTGGRVQSMATTNNSIRQPTYNRRSFVPAARITRSHKAGVVCVPPPLRGP